MLFQSWWSVFQVVSLWWVRKKKEAVPLSPNKVWEELKQKLPQCVSTVWESLCGAQRNIHPAARTSRLQHKHWLSVKPPVSWDRQWGMTAAVMRYTAPVKWWAHVCTDIHWHTDTHSVQHMRNELRRDSWQQHTGKRCFCFWFHGGFLSGLCVMNFILLRGRLHFVLTQSHKVAVVDCHLMFGIHCT